MTLMGTAEDAAVEECGTSLTALVLRLRPRRGSVGASPDPLPSLLQQPGALRTNACSAPLKGSPCGCPEGGELELSGMGLVAGSLLWVAERACSIRGSLC